MGPDEPKPIALAFDAAPRAPEQLGYFTSRQPLIDEQPLKLREPRR